MITDFTQPGPVGHLLVTDLDQARTRLLYSQSVLTFLYPVLAAIAVSALLWDVSSRQRLLGWAIITAAYSLSRFALLGWFRRRAGSGDINAAWLNLLAASVFVSGMLWGLAPIILVPNDPARPVEFTLYNGLVFLVICGLVAGAVVVYSWSMRVVCMYVLPALVPGALYLITLGDRYNSALGGFVLLYLVFILVAATRMHVQLRRYLEVQDTVDTLRRELADLRRRRGEDG